MLPYEILITDVDGVLTDGRYLYDLNGKQYKQFGPHDADAVKFFREMDVEVYAISADKRGFAITLKRLEDMDVEIAYVSEETRLTYIQEKASKGRVAFVGDGYFDIPALKAACIGYAPNNALTVVKNNADVVLPVSGGEGVLLSVFEHFLSLYDQELFDKYSKGELKHG